MDPAPGTKITERITLVSPLASGAMGAVWIAEHETLKTRVAVKLLPLRIKREHRSAKERFALEASAAARITSPHVVRMFDHGVTPDGTMFIVMELLSGESLAARMKRVGALPVHDTVTIIEQSCKALGAAHAQGLVHRDIKPANIFLIDEHGELFVKLLDFGVVKQLEPGAPALSEPGMLLGTPAYMSHDLLVKRGRETQPSVDLWSLCVVAYRCLTGALPFRAPDAAGVLRAIIRGEHDPPSSHRADLGPKVDEWFARAFDVDAERRIGDAIELGASFRALLATAPPAPTALAAPKRSARWPLMLLALAAAAIIAYGVVGRRSSPSPSTPAASFTVAEPPPLASSAPLVTTSAAPPAGPDPSALRARAAEAAAFAAERRHNEIFVPGGVTQLPADERDVAPFYFDRQEVTVRRFAECTLARACSDRRLQGPTVEAPELPRSASCNWHQVGREDHPMNCISFAQAESYCRWRGARLPSEAEWVRAARGDDARRLPWGNEPASCDRTVMADADGEGCGRGTSWKAGTRPEDVSAFGALDLGGNLREWVADAADASGATRLVKGGGYADTDPSHLQIDARRASAPSERSSQVGFRCARSVR